MVSNFARSLAKMKKRLTTSRALGVGPSSGKGGPISSHDRYMAKLRAGARLEGGGVLHMMGVKTKVKDAKDMAQSGLVMTAVESEKELAKLEMWQQGDVSLATEEKVRERQALRHDRRVLEALQAFWEAAQRSLHSGGDPNANDLHQEGHAIMLRRIYRVMIKGYDPVDAEKTIAEDWKNDSRGADTLSRKRFMDAFFELADTWTTGISGHEYAAFLWMLFGAVTVSKAVVDANGNVSYMAFVWKDEGDCAYDEATYGDDEEVLPTGDGGQGDGSGWPRGQGAGGGGGGDGGEGGGDGKEEKGSNSEGAEGGAGEAYRKKASKKGAGNQQKRSAAAKVQAKVRGKKARKEKEERAAAAQKIQNLSRGKIGRKNASHASGGSTEAIDIFSERADHEGGTPGDRGRLQYWALRKGLPAQLQEGIDGLTEDEWAQLGRLPPAKQREFVLQLIEKKLTEAHGPNWAEKGSGELFGSKGTGGVAEALAPVDGAHGAQSFTSWDEAERAAADGDAGELVPPANSPAEGDVEDGGLANQAAGEADEEVPEGAEEASDWPLVIGRPITPASRPASSRQRTPSAGGSSRSPSRSPSASRPNSERRPRMAIVTSELDESELSRPASRGRLPRATMIRPFGEMEEDEFGSDAVRRGEHLHAGSDSSREPTRPQTPLARTGQSSLAPLVNPFPKGGEEDGSAQLSDELRMSLVEVRLSSNEMRPRSPARREMIIRPPSSSRLRHTSPGQRPSGGEGEGEGMRGEDDILEEGMEEAPRLQLGGSHMLLRGRSAQRSGTRPSRVHSARPRSGAGSALRASDASPMEEYWQRYASLHWAEVELQPTTGRELRNQLLISALAYGVREFTKVQFERIGVRRLYGDEFVQLGDGFLAVAPHVMDSSWFECHPSLKLCQPYFKLVGTNDNDERATRPLTPRAFAIGHHRLLGEAGARVQGANESVHHSGDESTTLNTASVGSGEQEVSGHSRGTSAAGGNGGAALVGYGGGVGVGGGGGSGGGQPRLHRLHRLPRRGAPNHFERPKSAPMPLLLGAADGFLAFLEDRRLPPPARVPSSPTSLEGSASCTAGGRAGRGGGGGVWGIRTRPPPRLA